MAMGIITSTLWKEQKSGLICNRRYAKPSWSSVNYKLQYEDNDDDEDDSNYHEDDDDNRKLKQRWRRRQRKRRKSK